MAGSEIQEPFSLSFQGNSIHSGSISFGRFEKDGLSWEKRSSFSHNRYLEEVDKCSKPGSVTEMKAHFEAHFKKRGIRFPASLESQTWGARQTCDADCATESFEDYGSHESFSEDTIQSDSHCNLSPEQEKSQCEYDDQRHHCVSYDEILVNSDEVIELDEEGGVDHGTITLPLHNHEVSVECIAIKEDLGTLPLEIEIRDNDGDKEDCTTLEQTEMASDGVERDISHALSTKRHDVTPKAASRKAKGSSLSSNSKKNVDAKSHKELRPKKIVESRPPSSKKTGTRTPLATRSCKTGTKLKLSSTSASGFHFKCSERAEKRKEFYIKLEEKIHAKKTETNQVQAKKQQQAEAEMEQFRKSLNFKATPMPSFYNTRTKPGSQNKPELSKVAPSRRRHTTLAAIANRAVTGVGYKHGYEEAKTVKVMASNRKQSMFKDVDLQKGTRKSDN